MAHGSQAYLIVEVRPNSAGAEQLATAVRRSRATCVLLQPPAGLGDNQAMLAPLVRAVQAADCAALIAGDATVALALGADGVHLPHQDDPDLAEQQYRAARAILGAGRIVGAACGLARHNAMVLAELGADYVALGGAPDHDIADQLAMVTWWAEVFSVPCVAWRVTDPAQVGPLQEAGADFIAASPARGLEDAVALLSMLPETHEAIR